MDCIVFTYHVFFTMAMLMCVCVCPYDQQVELWRQVPQARRLARPSAADVRQGALAYSSRA